VGVAVALGIWVVEAVALAVEVGEAAGV